MVKEKNKYMCRNISPSEACEIFWIHLNGHHDCWQCLAHPIHPTSACGVHRHMPEKAHVSPWA